jgi:Protein of unknown function (DUF2793)
MTTTRLGLPEIISNQAQKEVTHNEALWLLDAILGNGCKSRVSAAPPTTPTEGDVYIIPAGASGAWSGKDGKLAQYLNAAWLFYTPQTGWRTWVADEADTVLYDGAKWTRQETMALGSETNIFKQCLNIIRNLVIVGTIDNNSSNIRVKSLGTAKVQIHNASNNGIELGSDNKASFVNAIPVLQTYTVATLPSAATFINGMIIVSNETGGLTPAFSDGTNWRRVADRAIVA